MFSRPVNCGLNPLPNSSKAETRPFTYTSPVVGVEVLQISCSKVDFPEPLRPTIPTVSPFPTSNETSRNAQKGRK